MAHDVCFGYEVRSDLAFEYLREGGATDVLEVAETRRDDPGAAGEPFREWLPRPERPFTARLFGEDGGWRLWVADMGSFHIDPAAGSIEVPRGAPPLLREERLWGIPTVLCFLSRGDHSLHAASVERDGRAIVVGAPGRFGKTTLAAALVGAGYRLLSEDSTCLRGSPEEVVVVPGPAMLRVRQDPDRRVEVPGGRVLQVDDRVHLAIEPQLRGTGDPVPADAIVFLREAEDGSASPRTGRPRGGDPRPLGLVLQHADRRGSHQMLRRSHAARGEGADLEPPPTAALRRARRGDPGARSGCPIDEPQGAAAARDQGATHRSDRRDVPARALAAATGSVAARRAELRGPGPREPPEGGGEATLPDRPWDAARRSSPTEVPRQRPGPVPTPAGTRRPGGARDRTAARPSRP